MTLREAVGEGAARLEKAGVPEAELDAWYLLEWTAGVSRSHYLAYPTEALTEEQESRFLDALAVFGTGSVFLPWALVLVFQKNYSAALILAVTYGVCVLAREILEPKLIGGKLGILPVVILASVYAGVKLYGFGGILLGPLSVLLIQELWRQVDAAEAKSLSGAPEL